MRCGRVRRPRSRGTYFALLSHLFRIVTLLFSASFALFAYFAIRGREKGADGDAYENESVGSSEKSEICEKS
jgi:hypothetical protein